MDGSQQYVYTIMYNIWLKLHIIWVVQFHGVSYGSIQSHYIEVAQEAIFMEQNMRFGLILGLLAILKKKFGLIMKKLLRWYFSCFRGRKKMFRFKKKDFSVCTKKLHNISFLIKKKF